MVFTEAKRYFVERRVKSGWPRRDRPRSPAISPACAATLQGEVEQFINAFTVNETYFYREDHQLACLTTNLLHERLRMKPRGETMRIWSVPCSTGEEPYSIAMWLLENWPRSTPTTSRSSAPISTPMCWKPPRPAFSASAR